jgi:DnaJ-class molecular chaperone
VSKSPQLASLVSSSPSLGFHTVVCACCSGSGLHSGGLCPACDGKQRIRGHESLSKCAECAGSGITEDLPSYYAQLCTGCFGTGWALGQVSD